MATNFPDTPNDFLPRSISNLRQEIIRRGGVQHASRYMVEFVSPDDSFVTYPTEINLPQRSFGTYDAGQPLSLWGTKRKVPVISEYDEVTMSFVLYQDFAERTYFEKWMDYIINKVDPNDDIPEFARPYFNCVGKIYISTLATGNDRTNSNLQAKITSKTLLDEAYPLALLPISMSADNTGYTTYVINFAYRKYYNLEVSGGGIISF